jgi:hypothetical protein
MAKFPKHITILSVLLALVIVGIAECRKLKKDESLESIGGGGFGGASGSHIGSEGGTGIEGDGAGYGGYADGGHGDGEGGVAEATGNGKKGASESSSVSVGVVDIVLGALEVVVSLLVLWELVLQIIKAMVKVREPEVVPAPPVSEAGQGGGARTEGPDAGYGNLNS